MVKWLGKLSFWGRKAEPQGPTVFEYGRYVHKPVIARALSAVIGISQAELCQWIENPEINIFLNGELIQGAKWALSRLHAGQYEIKIPEHDKIWRFHID